MVSIRSITVLVLATALQGSHAFTPAQFERGTCSSLRLNAATSHDFLVGVLGDLHIDPRKMEDYETGRSQWIPIFEEAKGEHGNVALVSLGDLGESKSVRPDETAELFAGTTECHEIAAEFLCSFGVPYEVAGGNHDLEGIDEFTTDQENLDMFLRVHNKPCPQFIRQIADKTLLVGLTSTVFRNAKYTSHQVTIDAEQLKWFEVVVKSHPAEEGWKLFVFSHAPPNGSGLRVLQELHVVNGCCWLNHSNESECRKFIELVREHRCIKAWFSGHFHLGQDYEDSITFPTIDPSLGPYPNRGSCVFAQTSVMRRGTSRDGCQQSRLIRGTEEGFQICTVDHKDGGKVRLDATITYRGFDNEIGAYNHKGEIELSSQCFKVYQPSAGDAHHPPDENLVTYDDSFILDPITVDTKKWWYMSCGRVLGLFKGMLIEYDESTLAPLGLVCGADEIVGKRIAVIESGLDAACSLINDEKGMEGAECSLDEQVEQSLILIDENGGKVVVVQPNEDGSFWRKIVRNKVIRMKEKRREQAAGQFAKAFIKTSDKTNVVSSWGPYTTISGTAKKTGVAGLTAPARLASPAA